jgi:hypothetical protein
VGAPVASAHIELLRYRPGGMGWLPGFRLHWRPVLTQEFTSAERCETARLGLIEYAKARGFEERLRPVCMQTKGLYAGDRIWASVVWPVNSVQDARSESTIEARDRHSSSFGQ